MLKTVAIFLSTIVLLMGILAWANHAGWPELESPPRQGEALDSFEWASGRAVHAEAAAHQLIREPQNTWSNLAFVAVGVVLMGHSVSRGSRLTGLALMAVGVGSFLYHASASRTLRNLDVGAMYSLFFVLVLLALVPVITGLRSTVDSKAVFIGFAAACFGIVATLFRNLVIFGIKPLGLTLVTGVTAGVFFGALLMAVRREPSARSIGSTAGVLVLFIAAVICQIGDRPGGWLCDPNAVIQGHAAWHVFAAGALFLGIRTMENHILRKPFETPVSIAQTRRRTRKVG